MDEVQSQPEPTSPFDDGCPFCAIARGADASAEIVAEAPEWLAFLPTSPATRGHTLVIPRMHFSDVWSLPRDLAGEVMAGVMEVGLALRLALRPDGMNLISSSGRAAEQSVFHVHLHVVPRWIADGFDDIWPPKKAISATAAEGLADAIRAAVSQLASERRR